MNQLKIVDRTESDSIVLPPILYKYRSYNDKNHLKIITSNCVYFAAPDSFADKKDCHLEEVFPSEAIVRKRIWENSFKEYPELSTVYRLRFVNNQVANAPILKKGIRDKLIEDLFANYCKCHGVFSVTANSSNDRMWKEYASNHAGFCIGFDSKKRKPPVRHV